MNKLFLRVLLAPARAGAARAGAQRCFSVSNKDYVAEVWGWPTWRRSLSAHQSKQTGAVHEGDASLPSVRLQSHCCEAAGYSRFALWHQQLTRAGVSEDQYTAYDVISQDHLRSAIKTFT